ncbi:MAG TPA: carbohydrate kinase [Blastocatellia bacterium]|nr:carbohydrate kinase [Blastocatellia bacterium]
MNNAPYTVVGLGELLWDILPSGEQLGGAPANFAYMSALLGDRGVVASRVGADALGTRAVDRLTQAGLATSHVQVDDRRATGTVKVRLDEQAKPTFAITGDVAWDFLEWTAGWQGLAAQADAVCFGSLAQRSPQSRATIRRFLEATRGDALTFFDVNLRAPFYSARVLTESLKLARAVKLNDEEVGVVTKLCGLNGGGDEDGVRRLMRAYDLEMICVTRGERGSLLLTEAEAAEHPGFRLDAVDTVGAGDAFSAAVVHHYLRGASLGRIGDAANRLGAWVASRSGAMPAAEQSVLSEIVRA